MMGGLQASLDCWCDSWLIVKVIGAAEGSVALEFRGGGGVDPDEHDEEDDGECAVGIVEVEWDGDEIEDEGDPVLVLGGLVVALQ